jgi:hypothetical protein
MGGAAQASASLLAPCHCFREYRIEEACGSVLGAAIPPRPCRPFCSGSGTLFHGQYYKISVVSGEKITSYCTRRGDSSFIRLDTGI